MALSIPFPKDRELSQHPVRPWTLRAPSGLTRRATDKAPHFPAQLQVSKDRTVHLPLLIPFFMLFFLLFSLRHCGNSQQGEPEASYQQTQANPIWNTQPILHLALGNSAVLLTPKQTQGARELHGQTISMSTAGGILPTAPQHLPVTPII
ncbi:hypothetical protein Nmel_010798 [Mimus melanotis]